MTTHTTTPATPDTLNRLVDFHSPFVVHEDGTISDAPGIYAPDLFHVDGEREPEGAGHKWEYVDGYSGQYRYSGPVMHASEQLAGGMARDVLETPGTYVLCVVECWPDDEDEEPEPAGWVLLRRVDEDRDETVPPAFVLPDLSPAQMETISHYRAYNVPATWMVGEPSSDGSVEVAAIGPDFVWSFSIERDGESASAEAVLGVFEPGFTV